MPSNPLFKTLKKGFTLIELVLVMVIIGILAAIALPRFANLQAQANDSTNRAFARTFQSSQNMLHAAWIAAGAPTATQNLITLQTDGGPAVSSVNSNGWDSCGNPPNGGASANCCALIAGGAWDWSQSVQVVAAGSGTCTDTPCYYVPSGASNSTCTYILYNGTTPANPARSITYNYSTGQVTPY